MGKSRLPQQPSLKISKKQPTHHFNSLIKVLKPKVYITNSSNFKTLVQKLTGNVSKSPIISSYSPSTTMPIVSLQPTQVIEIDDHDSPDPSHDFGLDPRLDRSFNSSPDHSLDFGVDPSLDCSLDHSFNSSPDPSLDFSVDHILDCNLDHSPDPSLDFSVNASLDCSLDHSVNCSPDPSLDNMFMAFDYSTCSSEELVQWPQDRVMDYVNEIELRNLESWLLDFDPSTFIHDTPFVPTNTYDYNYNLSSIM